MAVERDQLIHEVIWDDGDAQKHATAWDRQLQNIGKTFTTWPGIAGAAFGAITTLGNAAFSLLGKGFSTVVGNAISLEDAMSGVKRTANLTSDEMQKLTEQVREYSVDVLKGFGTSEQLAQALEQAGQQGIFAGKTFEQGSADALAFASTMVKAAVALDGLNLESASERLGLFHGTFTDVIPTIENAASVLNYFGNTSKRGSDFILTLSQNMAEMANAVGLSEGSTLALAGSLSNINQQASKTGTAMTRIMRLMASDTSKFAEVFRLNATEFKTLVDTDMEGAITMLAEGLKGLSRTEVLQGLKDMDLTGQGVITTMLGLANNVDKLKANFAAWKGEWEANTSLMNEFINNTDRLSSLWGAMKQIFNNVFGAIGDLLLPHLKNLVILINNAAAELFRWAKSSGFLTETLPRVMAQLETKMAGAIAKAIEFIKTFDWDTFFQNSVTAAGNFFGTTLDFMTQMLSALKFITQAAKVFGSIWEVAFGSTTVKATQSIWMGFFRFFKKEWDIMLGDSWKTGVQMFTQDWKTGWAIIQNDWTEGWRVTIENWLIGWDMVRTYFREWWEDWKTGWQLMADAIKGVFSPLKGVTDANASIVESMKVIEDVGWKNSVFPDMIMWADHTATSIEGVNTSLVNTAKIMASISEGLASGGFQNVSSDTLLNLARQPGLTTAQGSLQLTSLARQNQVPVAQSSGASISQQGAFLAGGDQPVTIVIQGGEFAKLTGIITREQRTQQGRVTTNLNNQRGLSY